jgi:hypothetical protein
VSSQPRVLIEGWLPIAEIGVESQSRELDGTHPPPLLRLHVWWARRPLVASRAAVLGSTLPAWSEDWPEDLLARFPTEKEYREWVVHQLGIRGDPVAARRRIQAANEAGIKLAEAYDGPACVHPHAGPGEPRAPAAPAPPRLGDGAGGGGRPDGGRGLDPARGAPPWLPQPGKRTEPRRLGHPEGHLGVSGPVRTGAGRRDRALGQGVGGAGAGPLASRSTPLSARRSRSGPTSSPAPWPAPRPASPCRSRRTGGSARARTRWPSG